MPRNRVISYIGTQEPGKILEAERPADAEESGDGKLLLAALRSGQVPLVDLGPSRHFR